MYIYVCTLTSSLTSPKWNPLPNTSLAALPRSPYVGGAILWNKTMPWKSFLPFEGIVDTSLWTWNSLRAWFDNVIPLPHLPPSRMSPKQQKIPPLQLIEVERGCPSLHPGPGALQGSLLHHQLIPRSKPSSLSSVARSHWSEHVWQEDGDQWGAGSWVAGRGKE